MALKYGKRVLESGGKGKRMSFSTPSPEIAPCSADELFFSFLTSAHASSYAKDVSCLEHDQINSYSSSWMFTRPFRSFHLQTYIILHTCGI